MSFYKKFSISGMLCILLFTVFSDCLFGNYEVPAHTGQDIDKNGSESIQFLNKSLFNSLLAGDQKTAGILSGKLLELIKNDASDHSSFSESYYLLGIYFARNNSFKTALKYISECIAVKEKKEEYDSIYMKAYYNMSVDYANLGNLKKYEFCAIKSIEIGKKLYGEFSYKLFLSYYSLGSAYVDMKDYEDALFNLNIALRIADENRNKVSYNYLAGVYINIGVSYNRLYDFSKAKIYLGKALSIDEKALPVSKVDYLNLLRNIASNNNSLGETDEAGKFYEKAVSLIMADSSYSDYSIVNNYASFLSKSNKIPQGEKILNSVLKIMKTRSKTDDRVYIEVLASYAGYLRDNKIDFNKSLECYEKCSAYIRNNDEDLYLKNIIVIGYSLTLDELGKSEEALKKIQSLLFSSKQKNTVESPPAERLKPDMTTLRILKTKYTILWNLYRKTSDTVYLKAASTTSALIVTVLDKVRINISEEESRLILGDKFRESYLNVIRDFNLLYNKTGDSRYLETAFEYSEKSKVAGLLASTRELKAAQLQIPADIGNLEKELQRTISLYQMRITDSSAGKKPNTELISEMKESLLEAVRKRDSLILVFEKRYPDYYAIKFNTRMAGIKDIPKIVGQNATYINYILSDTLLNTFIVNRKHHKLLVQHIDSTFLRDIKRYRILLSIPSPTDNALANFKEFQSLGYKLYKTLIEPVKPYLISDRVIISPDNFLSYLPFESFPTNMDGGDRIRYKELKYLMYDLDISYTYSATFLSETLEKKSDSNHTLIAFAPDYPESIDIQTVMQSRQGNLGTLMDLPFARQEAEYVSKITGGKLYENKNAKESLFKSESGSYDIIHLAMHTLLNDKDPMRSMLIFSKSSDSTEDGYLRTYEIYGIPLKAKMVVLSSCNTGIGMLYSGEGILSLARGFIYSGSLSVVMSMWEIEDKSGTEVVKLFYDNLEKGYSKSASLKRARVAFLKDADQLRSHPYFWSSMVIYGEDSALYSHNKLKISIIALLILIVTCTIIYYRNRRNS